MTMTAITVTKCDADGSALLTYSGVLIERGENWLCLDAFFARDDVVTPYVTFRKGDRMREWFFADRWFNIFELHDVDDDHLKGWYCNVTRPAVITADSVHADDLALDVFITAQGALTVLDEDEFAALTLSDAERGQALDAVAQIRAWAAQRHAPFDRINAP